MERGIEKKSYFQQTAAEFKHFSNSPATARV